MIASLQVDQAASRSRHHRCPRCGAVLSRDDRRGPAGLLASLLFLRGFRCDTACGWRGLRFSRRIHKYKQRFRRALVIAIFILAAALAVRYALSRLGSSRGAADDDGIQEVD